MGCALRSKDLFLADISALIDRANLVKKSAALQSGCNAFEALAKSMWNFFCGGAEACGMGKPVLYSYASYGPEGPSLSSWEIVLAEANTFFQRDCIFRISVNSIGQNSAQFL